MKIEVDDTLNIYRTNIQVSARDGVFYVPSAVGELAKKYQLHFAIELLSWFEVFTDIAAEMLEVESSTIENVNDYIRLVLNLEKRDPVERHYGVMLPEGYEKIKL